MGVSTLLNVRFHKAHDNENDEKEKILAALAVPLFSFVVGDQGTMHSISQNIKIIVLSLEIFCSSFSLDFELRLFTKFFPFFQLNSCVLVGV
jgi:hypothetical protein